MRLHKDSPLRRRHDGVALVWTAVLLTVFVGFVGLAIDGGYLWFVAHQLQNAADAAALAGAFHVRLNQAQAREAAILTAGQNIAARDPVLVFDNPGNDPGGDVVIGRWSRDSRVFTPTLTNPNAVLVNARRSNDGRHAPVGLLFMRALGFSTASVSRSAVAMLRGGIGAGVIVLDPTERCSFDVRGTAGTLSVDGGAIYVDATHPDAACHAGQPTVETEELYVAGETDRGFEDKVNFTGDLYPDSDAVPDPLRDLPPPTWNPASDLGSVLLNSTSTKTIGPGYYSGGITVRNGTLNLQPGVYVVDGAGLWVNGGSLIANGVMFYIIGTGRVDLEGNGVIHITPPDTSLYTYPATPDITPYAEARVPIFQARDNSTPGRILGTNNFSLDGTIYMPEAQLEIGGTSENFANGLIVDTLYAHGDGILRIDYQDQFPRLPRHAFLVR